MANVRAAMELEIIPMLKLAEEYQSEAKRWSVFSFDLDRAVRLAALSILDPLQQIFVSYEGNEMQGFIWVGIDQPVWSRDIIGYDHFLFVSKKHRNYFTAKALVMEFERWAKACGAKAIHAGANSGIFDDGPASALYKRLGYNKGGANFYKEL